MPSETFFNLPEQKQERIDSILLDVFSKQELAHVRVSQIVSAMQMSRGAFYKYFTDLADAYRYITQKAMVAIHDAVFQKIKEEKYQLFIGLRAFVSEFMQLEPYDVLYRYFILLEITPSDQTVSIPRHVDRHMWLEVLDKSPIEFQEPQEKMSYLIFIMTNLVHLLKFAVKYEWDEAETLKQFDYFISWLK